MISGQEVVGAPRDDLGRGARESSDLGREGPRPVVLRRSQERSVVWAG